MTSAFFISSLILALCQAQTNPTISFISEEQTVNVSDTVQLDCTVQNLQDYSVVWAKLGTISAHILSVNTLQITSNNRVSIQYDTSTSTYSLLINDAQESDIGTYQCRITTSTEQLAADVKVYVKQTAEPDCLLPACSTTYNHTDHNTTHDSDEHYNTTFGKDDFVDRNNTTIETDDLVDRINAADSGTIMLKTTKQIQKILLSTTQQIQQILLNTTQQIQEILLNTAQQIQETSKTT